MKNAHASTYNADWLSALPSQSRHSFMFQQENIIFTSKDNLFSNQTSMAIVEEHRFGSISQVHRN